MPGERNDDRPAGGGEVAVPVATGRPVRDRVYRSGRYLVGRQLAGIGIRLVGILVVTRLIGPEVYGLFAAAAAVAAVLATIATFGADVQLVREGSSTAADDTAFIGLLGSSVALGGIGVAMAPSFGVWLSAEAAVAPMRAVAALVPLMVLVTPARARLERELRFVPIAAIELGADLAVIAVSIPLAVGGAGVWAPIAGLAARQLCLVVATHLASRYRPRLRFDRAEAERLVRFGAGYSAGKWLSLVGQLVNPIVVGRVLGPTGIGHVALATRIVEQLGAVKQATMRLATAAFARIGTDRQRLRSAHAEGVLIQVVGSVPLYALAAFIGPFAVPAVFGPDWEPAATVLGLLAIAASIGTLFNLGPPLLRVLGLNRPVARLRALQVGTMLAVTAIAVPGLGVAGYGLARVARTVPFILVHRELTGWFQPSYRAGVRWLVALLPMMTAPWWPAEVRPFLLAGPILLIALPTTRDEIRYVARQVAKAGRS
ncbi:MAG: oligosaccharide flippase family protein [Actinomycetota bacterium]